MSTTAAPEDLTLQIDLEINANASPAKVFAALLQQLGPEFGPGEHRMVMMLEAKPGGRWFRDLGDNQGHLWGHVQVIKQDKLLEICGPLFMSYPAINHLSFRLTPNGNKTTLTFKHAAIGLIDPNHRQGVTEGWKGTLESIKQSAEK